MKLSDHERASPLWKKLTEYYTARLHERRVANDALAEESITAHNRGRIKEIKEFLALAERPAPETEADDPE